jgi:UDP:flavonoid glycosyltransferase YjiC (YdhE family)
VKRTAKPQAIAAAVREAVQDPSYRERAERLGAAIRRDAGSGALLRQLEAVGLAAVSARDQTRLAAGCQEPGLAL